jgi:hypothetical protein
VLIRIANRNGQLKPGMNTDVEIHIGQRDSVLAVPNASLRTARDVGSAAQVLGIAPDRLQTLLAAAQKQRDSLRTVLAANTPGRDSAKVDTIAKKPAGNTITMPDGRVVPLPPGVTEKQVRDIMAKFRTGDRPTPAEMAILRQLRPAGGGGFGAGGRRGGGGNDFQFGGDYIVFALRNGEPTPVYIRTGLTDLDYSEVTSGLTLQDSVLVLPSASLVQSQQDMKSRITQMTGGGAVPGMQQQPARAGTTTTTAPASGAARPPTGGARP